MRIINNQDDLLTYLAKAACQSNLAVVLPEPQKIYGDTCRAPLTPHGI